LIDSKEIRLFFLRHGYLLIIAAWLFTFAFLFSNYWSYYSSPTGVKRSLEKSIHERERAFDQLSKDTTVVNSLLTRNYNQESLDKLYKPDYHVFAYDSSTAGRWLTFWSTNLVQPDELPDPLKEGVSFQKLKNGYYEIICKKLADNAGHQQFLVGLIPVMMDYSINNNYLVNHFYDKPELGPEYTINLRPPGIPVMSRDKAILFYLHYDAGRHAHPPNMLSVSLRILGCICVLIFINLFATLLAKNKNPLYGFFFLAVVVITFRTLSYLYPFPFNLRALDLFAPQIYAKDEIFRSLGDLFINILLAFWLILFFREHVKTINPPVIKGKRQQWIITIIASFVMYVVGQFLSELIQSLVIDSKISFDVTDFFSLLNEYSIIGFIVLGFIAFSFLFFSQIINYLLNELTSFRYRTKYFFLAGVGIVWLLLRINHPEITYSIAMVIWLIVYVMLLDALSDRFENSIATVPFLFWLFILTITTSGVLVYYNTQKELTSRERMAEELSKQKDPYLEMLLNDVGKRMDKDEFMQFFFQENNNRISKEDLENELKQKYFKGYLNRFNINFYLFDGNGAPIYRSDTTSLFSFNRIFTAPESRLSGNDLYYHERSFKDYRYIGRRTFYRQGAADTSRHTHLPKNPDGSAIDLGAEVEPAIGYMVYELTPALFNTDRLYPELLVSGDMYDPNKETSAIYSYAVYDNGILVNNNNDFPFPIKLYAHDIPAEDITVKSEKGYSELIYKASKEKVVIVVKESRNFIEFITLFAYMFCLFLLIITVYKGLDLLIKARMRFSNMKNLVNISIRKKVHGTIVFIVVFAFVILGLTTILFFIDRSESQNRERLSKTIGEIAHDVEKVFSNQYRSDDLEYIYDPIFLDELSMAVSGIADDRALDINVYDQDGNLQLTTQPLINEKGLLSKKIDPKAYYQLFRLNRIQFIQKEKIGSMGYLSGYVPLRNNGEVYAYLNVPYFATQTELNRQISNFLVALINFNAFIFLIAGILALLITNSITKSFSLVTEKLRHVNLGQHNDEITWDKDDEIGVLVKEYNKMVRKLEVSAAKLAKSEREGAWREMARQVAHEIKNPLTPMKLSIQYLQRAIDGDSPNVKELSRSVAGTLVEQIEHLANIASDFSAFARIGEPNNEVLLLNEMLYSLTGLYQGQPDCDIRYEEAALGLHVFADKTQMNRLFTNLLQNAIQAIPEYRKGDVLLRISAQADGWVIVSVTDNGTGISPEVRPKIFVPNFTTKSSGTGLGLAMCKNIVEQAHGEIWFETTAGEGTTFYVKLPLVEE